MKVNVASPVRARVIKSPLIQAGVPEMVLLNVSSVDDAETVLSDAYQDSDMTQQEFEEAAGTLAYLRQLDNEVLDEELESVIDELFFGAESYDI
jgi:hypothetical protein